MLTCDNAGTKKSVEMSEAFRKIKDAAEKDAAEMFVTRILPMYVPSFEGFCWGGERES